MRILIVILAVCAQAFGVGSNPRYIEEIAFGGGYGSTGGWLEADGDLYMDGNFVADGTITSGDGSSIAQLKLNGAAASARTVWWQTNGSLRWSLTTVDAEGGANAGSELYITRYDDAGASIETWKWLDRSDGTMAAPAKLDVAGIIEAGSGNIALTNATGNILSAAFADAANIAMLNEAETIAGNWVNTANPWAVNEGGSGTNTLTSNGVVIGNGTSAVTVTAEGATGTVLIGNTGADPSFSASPSLTAITLSGDAAVNGGDITTTAAALTVTISDTGAAQTIDLDPRGGSGDTSKVRAFRYANSGVTSAQVEFLDPGGSNFAFLFEAQGDPYMGVWERDAAVDNGRWREAATGEQLVFSALTDAGAATAWLTVDRTGATADTIALAATTTTVKDLQVLEGDVTTDDATINLFNATATTVNFGGAATTLSIGAATGTATFNNATLAMKNISSSGALSTFGDNAADRNNFVGSMEVRQVTDAGPMTATNGTVREIVFNTSDSKFYGCSVTGTPATWVALN